MVISIMDAGFPFFLLLIPVAFAIAIGLSVVVGSMDRERIRSYIESRGGKIIETTWAPFGPGWFGGSRESTYHVRYRDHEGNIRGAYARTSMWSGVYFTEDSIVQFVKAPIDEEVVESLEEENARLRAELDRLKRKERDRHSEGIEE
jgi:hypothetical protein